MPAAVAALTHPLRAAEHEHKFILEKDAAGQVLAAAARHVRMCVYDPARPVAFARTTYLDTADLAHLRASNEHGASHVRLREYACAPREGGMPRFTGVCWLEHKRRLGSEREKTRVAVPATAAWRLLAGTSLRPWAASFYQRTSFAGEDDAVRITVDQDVTFLRPGPLARAGEPATPAGVVAAGPGVLLEVKHFGPQPGWLRAALAGLVEARGFSKFRGAMEAVRCAG